MHNHDNKSDSWMMWIMMICCMAPVLLLLTSGGAFAQLNWPILGGVALLLGAHWYFMKKMHRHADAGGDNKSNGHHNPGDKHSGH